MLYLIASGKAGVDPLGFASNGYGAPSPGGYSLLAGFCAEAVLAFMFLLIILGATAVFADGWALQQLWLFWVAPILGGALGGLVYPFVAGPPASSPKR